MPSPPRTTSPIRFELRIIAAMPRFGALDVRVWLWTLLTWIMGSSAGSWTPTSDSSSSIPARRVHEM